MAFIQHENEVMNLAAEMRETTQQKPILCLESHMRLFRGALDSIMEAYSNGEYSDEDLRKEYCPDVTEVYTDWMRYSSDVLTSMKLICLWLEMWKETTFVTQSMRRGLGSIQVS